METPIHTSIAQAVLREDDSVDVTLRKGKRAIVEACGDLYASLQPNAQPTWLNQLVLPSITRYALNQDKHLLEWYVD
jgi:hypothetical protein